MVFQLDPVAKEINAEITKKIAGNQYALKFIGTMEEINSAVWRCSITPAKAQAKIKMTTAGTMVLKPSIKFSILSFIPEDLVAKEMNMATTQAKKDPQIKAK
jgi:hypothetical protein